MSEKIFSGAVVTSLQKEFKKAIAIRKLTRNEIIENAINDNCAKVGVWWFLVTQTMNDEFIWEKKLFWSYEDWVEIVHDGTKIIP